MDFKSNDTELGKSKFDYMILARKRRENMNKEIWKPGNMLYPLPAVMVRRQGREPEYYHCGVDGNHLHKSGDAVYFGAAGTA